MHEGEFILLFSGTGNTGHIWHCSIVLFVMQTDVLTFHRKGRITVSRVITGLLS